MLKTAGVSIEVEATLQLPHLLTFPDCVMDAWFRYAESCPTQFPPLNTRVYKPQLRVTPNQR
jgi:hypothetical protein